MSEPISAFAVYRANGVQKNAKKNNKTRSPGKPSPKARTANGGAAAKGKNNKVNGGTSAASKNGKNNSTVSYNNNNNNNVKKTSDPLAADMALLSKPASQLSKAERKKQNELRKFYGLNANNQVISQSDASMGDSALEYTVNSHAGSSDEDDDDYDVECGEEEGEYDSGEEEAEDSDDGDDDDDDDDIIEDVQDMEEVEVDSSDNDTDAPEEYVNDEDAEEFNLAAIRAAKKSTAGNKRRSTEAASTAEEVTTQPKQPRSTLNVNRRPSAAVSPKPKTPEPVVAKRVVSNVKLEPFSPTGNAAKSDSLAEGEKLFRWLLNPLQLDEFYSKFWEQGVCLIKREQRNYYSHLISFEKIGQMLLQNHVEFTKNLDITRYRNGKRETLNPEGRALPPAVWDQYRQGCSVRLLNPQTFIPTLHALCATMQEYFHCLVGVNAYLTPAGTQGFAPHYDDIEAFVLQIEGKKRWRLYKPRKPEEHLPRFSSENFKQSEIGQPIFDDVLKPGDLLYFPRGTIHQACSEPDVHSLHLTLSVYQKQSYADLFERMMPLMLEKAFTSHLEIRRGLPLHLWRHAGIAFSDNDTKERADLQTHLKKLVTKCLTAVPMEQIIDQAVDQMAKKYQHEALPPVLSAEERSRTIFGSVSRTNDAGQWVCDFDITIRSNVRLLRANILRLIEEEGQMRIYYYLDNSKEYCEYEPNFIEIERREAASVEVLIRSYPQYVSVSQLPLKSDERKIGVVSALWERGLLMLEKPF